MRLIDAEVHACSVVAMLEPWCERIEIGGSIRRKSAEVGDIEIVCIPKHKIEEDLLESYRVRDPGFAEVVECMYKVKGDPCTGRYTQRLYEYEKGKQIVVDIFICRPENWGVIFAVRTGPAWFSKDMIAKRAHKFGLYLKDGFLHDHAGALCVPEEADLFKYLELDYIEPWERR